MELLYSTLHQSATMHAMDRPGSTRRKLRNLQLNNLINGYQRFTDLNKLAELLEPIRCLSESFTESCIVGIERYSNDLPPPPQTIIGHADKNGHVSPSSPIRVQHEEDNENANAIDYPVAGSSNGSDCQSSLKSRDESEFDLRAGADFITRKLSIHSSSPDDPHLMNSNQDKKRPRSPVFHFAENKEEVKVMENATTGILHGGREPDITYLPSDEDLLTPTSEQRGAVVIEEKKPIFLIPESDIDIQDKEDDPQHHIGAKLYSTVKRRLSKTLSGYGSALTGNWEYDSSDDDIPDDYIPMFVDQSPDDFWERESLVDYVGDKICGILTGSFQRSRSNSANAINGERRVSQTKNDMSPVVEETTIANGCHEPIMPKVIKIRHLADVLPNGLLTSTK